ncbi:MAG: hypothetical protein MUF39_09650 [Cyclobacteriaceae bacterium]|jgi:hypothetical protein|nr:hypothetical protein [Cyclobacteriaceae bacterium]
MILKIFKGVWFFSLLGLLAVFFYVYASLPETVFFSEERETYAVSRDTFFYFFILTMALVNVLVFFIDKLFTRPVPGFHAWFYGLVISLNAFFFSTLLLTYVLNGGDRYDFTRMGPAVFGSMILILLWLIGGSFYFILKKNQTNISLD